MTAIAGLLGISSVSLAKTCERRGIPTPDRGYWQKVAAGHALPPRPPLREVEVELPMPWERTPVVDAALARLMPKAEPEVHTPTPEVMPGQSKEERSAQQVDADKPMLDMEKPPVPQEVTERLPSGAQSLPLDIEGAIALARRLEDLEALKLLTEVALQVSSALPPVEEDRIRDWVTHIRSAMRDLDPLRHLTKSARAIATQKHGQG
jgi:hypothetical protein